MLYSTRNCLVLGTSSFVFRPSYDTPKKQHFGNSVCFYPKVKGWRHLLCWVRLFHLRTQTEPVFETMCPLQYPTMDKVQNLTNSEIYYVVHKKRVMRLHPNHISCFFSNELLTIILVIFALYCDDEA
jgi:hypothetical protein